MRLVYENGTGGPRRTVQAGSGYRSQNSSTLVLGIGGMPTNIEITWFDGTETTVMVERGVLDYEIDYGSQH